MLDPVEFGKAMAAIVREHTAPLLKRIEQLEARQPERGEKGERGEPGPAGIGERGEVGPVGEQGKQGEQGAPGRDAEPIDVKEVVAELLSGNEISTIINLHVAEAVQKHFEANPVQNGKDGRDGINGKDGERGGPGERGEKGEAGADGVGLAGAMIDRDGCLIVTTTKGAPINLGKVVGADGERGKDGADFTDVSFDYDGSRGLIIRGKGGEIVKKLPIPKDAGYWREGMSAEKGDIVTHAGTAWIAIDDTKSKPCHECKDWRLFARGGRDGIDGRSGRDLGPAQPVKLNGNA